jgi:hypothetical protein
MRRFRRQLKAELPIRVPGHEQGPGRQLLEKALRALLEGRCATFVLRRFRKWQLRELLKEMAQRRQSPRIV